MSKLSHFDKDGKAAMVDVSAKDVTERRAVARGRITMKAETLALIREGTAAKGDVLGVARVAGIMAAKKTSDLIPLCHPLPITEVSLDLECDEATSSVEITAEVKVSGKTGVEMEALTAVSVAALTIYDMVKAADKEMVISDITLAHKEGGKSGTFSSKKEAPPLRSRGMQARPAARAEAVKLDPVPEHVSPNAKREALRHFMEAKRIKPRRWAQDAGIASGTLYSFLQGRLASLSAEDEAKLAAALRLRPEDLYPGL
ncbi:MAG: cyclic pyranopterin monophosphate synthase MoaC [Alphaproteobacteria bacterium]|nr:MAG: cyclic pyranopterin monophosphate synthase MoaC [Alphaproteobacteria bacterium]